MKRKISSKVLLIAFLGLLFHGMVPHHHHDDISVGAEQSQSFTNASCDSDDLHQYMQETCEIGNVQLFDNHHECPHHFHTCVVAEFEIIPTTNAQFSLEKSKISKSELQKSNSLASHYRSYLKIGYSDKLIQIPELHFQGIKLLRAHPIA